MVDIDGSYTYSQVRNMVRNDVPAILAYPNPTIQNLEVRLSNWQNVKRIQIFDLQGRECFVQDHPSFSNHIEMRLLKPGTYIVQVTYLDKTHKSLKVVKQ